MLSREHIDRCNGIIPTIVKGIPSWNLLVHIPEDFWTYENFRLSSSADVLVRFVVTEFVAGSEDASDDELYDRCVELVEAAVNDLQRVSEALRGSQSGTKTKEHFIQWDNRGGISVTAHPSKEAAERFFRQQEDIPDNVTIEEYFEMREDDGCGCDAPDWMDTRDNHSHILGQIEISQDEGGAKPQEVSHEIGPE